MLLRKILKGVVKNSHQLFLLYISKGEQWLIFQVSCFEFAPSQVQRVRDEQCIILASLLSPNT